MGWDTDDADDHAIVNPSMPQCSFGDLAVGKPINASESSACECGSPGVGNQPRGVPSSSLHPVNGNVRVAEGSCSFCQIFSECALPLEMVDKTFAVWVIASVFENSGTATVYQAPASMVVFLVCGKETTDTQVVYEKVTCRPKLPVGGWDMEWNASITGHPICEACLISFPPIGLQESNQLLQRRIGHEELIAIHLNHPLRLGLDFGIGMQQEVLGPLSVAVEFAYPLPCVHYPVLFDLFDLCVDGVFRQSLNDHEEVRGWNAQVDVVSEEVFQQCGAASSSRRHSREKV
eukprot:scaffold1_cov375-Pavlova_lutheri.AAC.12